MATKQVQDEKLQLQKILLKYEAIFGKPVKLHDIITDQVIKTSITIYHW